MKVSPLTRYADPRYPARNVLDDHPELLRVLPNRWRRSAVVGTALAAACGLVATGWQAAQAAGEPVVNTPPIFEHGRGQGSFGCVAVAPPVFLSEDEARHVIIEEARTAGIEFIPDRLRLELDLPITSLNHIGIEDEKGPVAQRGTLLLDGTDGKKRISYEYVSVGDFYAWREPKERVMSTVSTVNLIDPAKTIRDSLAKTGGAETVGIFYDPAVGKGRGDITDGDGMPFSESTLAPLPFFKNFQGVKDVNYYEERGMIHILVGEKRFIGLHVGSTEGLAGGKMATLPVAPVLINRTPYLPLGWMVEQLGGKLTVEGKWVVVRAPEAQWDMRSPVKAMAVEARKGPASVAFSSYDRETADIRARENAREELRAQVRDFITWLKAEGVI